MSNSVEITSETLEDYEDYLTILARQRIGLKYQVRIPPSDIVQQTLLEAHQERNQFRGSTQAEVAAWLRRILTSRLIDAFRAVTRDKRDITRERLMSEAIDESHLRLEKCLATVQSSPSVKAGRKEQLVRLAQALSELRDSQRQAIELKFLQGLSVQEAALEMQKSPAAIGGLLRRGLEALEEMLSDETD
jgi:RNA polymerase sigma-70 factor (ECF subfamily)